MKSRIRNLSRLPMLRTFKLKNVEKPIEVYAISNVGLIVPKFGDNEGKD